MENLIDAIEENLPEQYQVLEGDDDTIYVVDTETDIHYAIHIAECND